MINHGSRKLPGWVLFALVIAIITALVALGYRQASHRSARNRSAIDGLSSAVDGNASAVVAMQDALSRANRVIIKHGGSPVSTPSVTVIGPVGPAGPPGPTGPPGLKASPEQIAKAVDTYCTLRKNCQQGPTAAQVAAAVTLYCNNRGKCKGPAGKPGKAGASGVAGASGPEGPQGQTGQQGDPPTDDQILNAVFTYCSNHGGCQGPPGEKGSTGAPGESGSNGADGNPPVSWTFTYLLVNYICVRDQNFDPQSPTYSCNPS